MESTITSQIATNSSELFKQYQFLGLDYWLGTPAALSLRQMAVFEVVSTLAIIFVLVILGLKFLTPKLTPPENRFFNKIIYLTAAFGPIGWLLVIFRTQGVVVLSARIFWVVWATVFLFVLLYLFRFYKTKLPNLKANHFSYQLKRRYFPKKKR